MKKYSTLLFDADMTLFDFESAERTAFGIVLGSNGIQYTGEDFERYKAINKSLWQQLERGEITKEYLQTERYAAFLATLSDKYSRTDAARFNAEYVEALSGCPNIFDGAEKLCRELYGKYDMYIVTNGVSRTQKRRFEKSAIKPYFSGIFVSEDAGAPKPMREYFDYVFGKIGERRRESLLIGDSLSSDIAGGSSYGIDTVWYNTTKANCGTTVPTYTVSSYDELRSLLIQGEN